MTEFDGLELNVEKPHRLELMHPVTRQPMRNGDGQAAYIDHYSNDSEIARKQLRAVQRRRLAMRGRLKIAPEELEAETLDTLAALTAGWYLVDLNGNVIDLPFSQDNARRLYANPGLTWLREQLEESASDRANFAPGSSTT